VQRRILTVLHRLGKPVATDVLVLGVYRLPREKDASGHETWWMSNAQIAAVRRALGQLRRAGLVVKVDRPYQPGRNQDYWRLAMPTPPTPG
jgi:hypothetical protein